MTGIIATIISFAIAVKDEPNADLEDVLPEDTSIEIRNDIIKDNRSYFYV